MAALLTRVTSPSKSSATARSAPYARYKDAGAYCAAVAGAIANGLFAAIGVRVRTLPLTAENVVQAIG